MKISGPILTIAAVAALGVGILSVNISKENEPSGSPAAESTTTLPGTAPAPTPAPSPAPSREFPARADYVAKIPTAKGTITLGLTVDAEHAVAYACDGNTVETWLRGSATKGVVSLTSKDKTSRIEGRLEGTAIVGTLSIGNDEWQFNAAAAQPPAGLYVYESAGVRNSWIVDPTGTATGVQRRADGRRSAAPGLAADGVAIVDGVEVTAIRVQGSSDV
ncbi:hypothetical protein QQ44_15475 [Mycolicibacterium setense]|uniref:Uncharacterized protein n=1 Tax=Mycolicibacterium setense TaxID=431269 RepID=A0ABR4YTN2_9MYCO|nr:hypothetical protein [Mycolicibacterium setense]KHO24425.1 hypothetical protein QQ44_15475 [Mycolicibacterium setense]